MIPKRYAVIFVALAVMAGMAGSCHAYSEFLDYSTSPLMAINILELVTHQYTLGYLVYTNETISNCSVVYSHLIYEPYTLIPKTFIGYGDIQAVYNKTAVVADNVTWNYITVTLPTHDTAESRYLTDLVCEGPTGDYIELGCESGCLVPNEINIFDYTERETTYRNIVAGSEFGYLVAGPIAGLSENVSISGTLKLLIVFFVLAVTIAIAGRVF